MDLLSLLFPRKCLECGVYGKYICDECLDKVGAAKYSFGRNLAIFKYEGVIRKAIIALKYKFASDVAEEIAEACAGRLKGAEFSVKAILTPVPLFKKRLNYRGFNQAELLGKAISQRMDWKFIPDLLTKNIDTKTQVGLRGDEREINLAGSFYLNPKVKIPKNKQIFIFDDVYTTGATMRECLRVLRRKGFDRAMGLTVAG